MKPSFTKLEKILGIIFLMLMPIFSLLVLFVKGYTEWILLLGLITFIVGCLPVKKYGKIKDFEKESRTF
ncbi:hypothetical protein [Haemophilus sp. SZY H52]|uniref:hypothetical protein n=1 Tax=Haemophilus sp. SZY H52 TaxID=3042471 RepID=UPI0035113928